jgi:hypothetical protein
MKRSRGGRSSIEDVDAVLNGRVVLSAEGLLALIREVNPTHRDLPAAEEARRYAIKSRLQSLLIRRHGDLLSYEEDAPGVVAIRLGVGLPVGSHALLSALDDEARSRVRWALDTPRVGPTGAPPPAPVAPRGDLARLAQAALDDYDYEGARDLLLQWFERSGRGVEATLAWLGFLTDTLGDDAEVIAQAADLPRPTASHPRVRAMVALAMARGGELAAVGPWLEGAEGSQVNEALARVVGRHLDAGDTESAARVLDTLREREPARPDILQLGERLGALRARRRQPQEDGAAQALEAGELDRAEALARAVLTTFGDSQVARTVLRRVQEARREGELAGLRLQVREALASGDEPAAASLLRRILTWGPDALVEHQLAELQARITRRADAGLVTEVVGRLQELNAGSLEAYAELPPRVREAVRAAAPLVVLQWVEEAGLPERPNKRREGVAAVLALVAARTQLAADPEGALLTLRRSEALLGQVSGWRASVAEAGRRVAANERAAAERAMDAADRALEADDSQECRAQLARVVGGVLDDLSRGRLDRLQAALAAAEDNARLVARVEAEPPAEGLILARRAAERTSGVARQRWEERARALTEAVRRESCLEVAEGLDFVDVRDRGHGSGHQPSIAMSSDGRWVVVGTVRSRWLFLYEVSVDAGDVRRGISLRMPWVMVTCRITADEDFIWVGDGGERLVVIDRRAGEVLRTASFASFTPAGRHCGGIEIVPGSATVSVRIWGARKADVERLVDLEEMRMLVDRRGVRGIGVVPDPDGARFVSSHLDGAELLISVPDGRAPERLRGPEGYHPVCVARGPEGGWLVLSKPSGRLHETMGRPVVHHLGRLNEPAQHHSVADASVDHPAQMVFASDQGLELVRAKDEASKHVLIGLRWEDGQPSEVFRHALPEDTNLVQDPAGRYACLVGNTPHGCVVHEVTDRLPVLPPGYDLVERPWFDLPFHCRRSRLDEQRSAWQLDILSLASAQRPAWAAQQCTSLERAQDFVALHEFAESCIDPAIAAPVVEAMRVRFPDSPELWLIEGCQAAAEQRWADVRGWLTRLDPAALGEDLEHVLHLLAIAHLRLGDPQAALKVLSHPESLLGSECRVSALREVARSLTDTPEPEPVSSIRTVIAVIRKADTYAAAGDHRAVIRTLSCPEVWWQDEAQSVARLARAWLAVEVITPADRHRKRWALASFRAHTYERPFSSPNFPLGAAALSLETIVALKAQAEAWLDGEAAVSHPAG